MLKFIYVNSLFLAILALLVFGVTQGDLPWYSLFWWAISWLALTFLGATNIRWNYFLPSLHKNPRISDKSIALTFDDGPTEITLSILTLLKKYNVKATFFCIGQKIDAHPEIFKKIIAEGHEVGNHSYSHSPLIGFYSTQRMLREIEACDRSAKAVGGVELHFFRPPGGVTNPNIRNALRKSGHQSIGWSIRSFDALFKSRKIVLNLATHNVSNGDVILLHDSQKHTLEILEHLLLSLKHKKFKLITIGKLFNIHAYR